MLLPIWQRLLGILLYLIPWSDSIPFGSFLFIEFPFLKWLAIPAIPIAIIEQAIPFGGFLLFLILFLAVIRNPKVPYFIRFNALQALLLDIGVVLLRSAFQIIIQPIGNGLIIRTFSSTILVTMLAIAIFAIVECLKGNEPDIPGVSTAVRMQLN